MSVDVMFKDPNWISAIAAAVSAIAAAISAFMAQNSAQDVRKSQRLANASLLSTHFHNVRDLLEYVKTHNGLSPGIRESKRESIKILKIHLSSDQELLKILDNIDVWLQKQQNIDSETQKFEQIMRTYLNLEL